MAVMVLALLADVLVLLVNGVVPPLGWALGLGLVTFGAVMAGEPRMFPRMVVDEYDGRRSLPDCRRRHIRQCALAGVVNGAFVTIGVAVGQALSDLAGAGASPAAAVQMGVATAAACAWLGLSATAMSVLSSRGWLAATPELPPPSLRRLGYSWREVIGASLQSSIGEEILYRLVIVGLVWHLAGQPLIGVVLAAALWSATHDVGDVRPRLARSLELFVLGCALGLVLLLAGFVAAIATHFLFNLLLLGWPLLKPGTVGRTRRIGRAGGSARNSLAVDATWR